MEYFKNKYSEIELIRKDNWADIYVAINNETNEKVQLRVLKSQNDNTKYINSITYEINQLQDLKHKNLIGINGVSNFIDNNTVYYYVETEYFKGKTLADKMILTSHTCKESLEIIKQVAKGLNEFHYRGINYETLNAENIFVNSEGVAKIDVLSYIQQKYDESEEYENYDEFDDGKDKDIYAIGVILYQLITRDQNFKLKKLKKNIEDDEVYSILYSLTSKKVDYRYEDLNEFLSDINEHLKYLSLNSNEHVQKLEEVNDNEIEDDFEEYEDDEYDDESNKSVLIKRFCACLAVILVFFGGIKVVGLVKKDNSKAETPIEMVKDEEYTDEEALKEESEEEQLDEQQVESTDTNTYTNDYNLDSDTNTTTNTTTNNNSNSTTTQKTNNNTTTTQKPSNSITTQKPNNGTTTQKPSNSHSGTGSSGSTGSGTGGSSTGGTGSSGSTGSGTGGSSTGGTGSGGSIGSGTGPSTGGTEGENGSAGTGGAGSGSTGTGQAGSESESTETGESQISEQNESVE